MPPISEALVPAVGYLIGLLVVALLNAREFSRSPEKLRRYEKLPVYYRWLCWFAVVPLFTAAPLYLVGQGRAFVAVVVGVVLAPLALLVVEALVVRWYRKVGLL